MGIEHYKQETELIVIDEKNNLYSGIVNKSGYDKGDLAIDQCMIWFDIAI